MLILSTYRVVLHPSYLQKVFSFIIFIKERYRLRFSPKKAELLEACRVGGAKEWRALAPIANKTQTFNAVSLTICSSESWPGSFIAGTAPSFSIKRCANPVSNWALFIKRSSTKHLRNSIAAPEKQTISTVHITVGSFGKLNKVIFSSQPKTHFFRDILPERVPCCQPADWSALMGALSFSLWSMRVRARSSGRNAHIRSSTVVYVIRTTIEKKSPKLVRNRKWDFWHRNTLLYVPIFFWNFVHA